MIELFANTKIYHRLTVCITGQPVFRKELHLNNTIGSCTTIRKLSGATIIEPQAGFPTEI